MIGYGQYGENTVLLLKKYRVHPIYLKKFSGKKWDLSTV
jgi:hypothetical protein